MPKATRSNSIPRRSALFGAACIPLTPLMQPAGPDAALMAACAAFLQAHMERVAVNEGRIDPSDDDMDAWSNRYFDAVDEIAATAAETKEGVEAKGLALRRLIEEDVPPLRSKKIKDYASPSEWLAYSLARDLTRRADAA